MSAEFSYDVFLSHNSKDKQRVHRLAERLKQAGLRVWFDEWCIPPGGIIALEVDKGLTQSRVLLLCVSPNALVSDWVALERSTAIHRDPSNADRHFIPLLLTDCKLPDTLRRYKYIDFREETDARFEELLVSCRIPAEAPHAVVSSTPETIAPRPSFAPLSMATRQQLLERVKEDQVDSRLGQGLREAIRVDLNLIETFLRPKMYVFSEESVPPKQRETRESIQSIFENAVGGSLVILGEPGTGKTNLLLELADSLIKDASRDPDRPIPVVFSLARWTLTERDRTFGDWMIDELKSYDVGAKAAEDLVRQDCLLPLLDGLDEVAQDRRLACVKAIREYQNGPSVSRRIAVCCRLDEYTSLGTKPDIKTEIRVEMLTSSDVDREIAKPGLEYVRQALAVDPALRSVIKTPLWLHVLYLAARVETVPNKALAPLDRLFAQYVDYALGRDPAGLPRKRTDPKRLLHWLGCLAAEMQRRDQTQFAIDDLNFSWFTSRRLERPHIRKDTRYAYIPADKDVKSNGSGIVRAAQRVSFGLAVGLPGWLIGGLVFGIVVGLMPAIRVEGRIEAAEDLCFEWRGAMARLAFSVVYGTILGLAFGLTNGLIGGLCLGLATGLFETLLGGFRPRSISRYRAPNLKTRRSLHYAFWIAMAGCVFAASLAILSRLGVLLGVISLGSYSVLFRVALLIVIGAVILGCEKGGWFALRHYSARFLLWRRGLAPLAYVEFLNEAVERLFLIRRGGSYEFLHATFRDYMAVTYGPNDTNTPQALPNLSIKAGQILCIA